MPDAPSQKTRFVAEYAERTGMPLKEVRQRVRSLFDAGIGPRGHGALTSTDLASYVIGILASPTHQQAGEVVERFSAFFVREADLVPELFPDYLPRLPQTPLRRFLAGIIQELAEGRGVRLVELSADWPPHDAFRITLISAEGKPYTATFRPEVTAVRRMRQPDLHRYTLTLPGHVLEAVAGLVTSDNHH